MKREANQWMFDACECELDGHQNCYDDMSKNQHSFYIDSVLNEMFCDDDEGMFQFYSILDPYKDPKNPGIQPKYKIFKIF